MFALRLPEQRKEEIDGGKIASSRLWVGALGDARYVQ
jgi:hypothetical protein